LGGAVNAAAGKTGYRWSDAKSRAKTIGGQSRVWLHIPASRTSSSLSGAVIMLSTRAS